jgi:transposase-like protein
MAPVPRQPWPPTLRERLEQAIERRQVDAPSFGIRTLAGELAGGDPDQIERWRRATNKYLRGDPSKKDPLAMEPKTAALYERALATEPGFFLVERSMTRRPAAQALTNEPLEETVAGLVQGLATAKDTVEELTKRVEVLEASAPRRRADVTRSNSPGRRRS